MQPSCAACNSSEFEDFCQAFDRVSPGPESTWTIRRCKACGFGWTHPPLRTEEIAGYYPPSYLGDAERMLDEFLSGKLQASRSWRGETDKARLVESRVAGGAILDVGCGDGKFLLTLDARKWNRTGIDFARQTLELVQARFPSLRLIPGSIESTTDLAPGSYDAVTFWHVLEHLPDPAGILRRAAALLRPNGWLFVSLPNLDSLQAALFRRNWYAFDDVPRHLWHFSRRSLDIYLQQAGLQVRDHLFFSRGVSFHCLKHSLIHWSEGRFGSRVPYYALKPALFAFPLLELLTARYGIMTTIAQAPEGW